jgi:hypothetical protein
MTRAPARFLSQDVLAGLVFLAVGVFGLVAGRDLEIGTADEMGTGYVPRLMAIVLIVLGAVIAAVGMMKRDAPLGRIGWRPVIMVTLATLAFGLTLERLGAVVAVTAAVTIASFAGERMSRRSLASTCAVLALAVVVIFIWGLGLPVRALPRFD